MTVTGAGYTGLAIAGTGRGERLFWADFVKGTVDVFNSSFEQVKLSSWQLTDPRLPQGYRWRGWKDFSHDGGARLGAE